MRKKEVEKTKSALKNLKHARRSSCSLRVELREMKRRCIENEEVMRKNNCVITRAYIISYFLYDECSGSNRIVYVIY